jgi:hypothetical protein
LRIEPKTLVSSERLAQGASMRGERFRTPRRLTRAGPRSTVPPSLRRSYGVSRETNSLAGSVASVFVNIDRNWPPAGDKPT